VIKWISKKSVLNVKTKIISAGMEIPAGILSEKRISELKNKNLIEVLEKPVEVKIEKLTESPVKEKSKKNKIYESEIITDVFDDIQEEFDESSER